MMGEHCIKSCSTAQGAVALSSAEAEFDALMEAVLRAKGLLTLATELCLSDLRSEVKVATDSSAAKSFVSKRGLGKMRHIEVRGLWSQEEVLKGQGGCEGRRSRAPRGPDDKMLNLGGHKKPFNIYIYIYQRRFFGI